MTIVKKYLFYKRAFFVCNLFNVFFITAGIIAFIHYAKTQEISGLELGVVGSATLVFGVLIPLFIFHKLKKAAVGLRKDTERTVAQWMAGWLDQYHEAEESEVDPVREPHFWLNIILMTVELFGEKSKHPVAKMVGEFAPLLKSELNKHSKNNSRKSSRGPGSKDGLADGETLDEGHTPEPKAPRSRRTRKARETA